MTDRDPLLEQLARVARARETARRNDELFERLAAGTLEPEQLKELELEAEQDPDVKLKLELYRPLGDGAVERVLRSTEARAIAVTGADALPPPARTGRVFRRAALVAGGLAALAASLWLALPLGGSPLPSYTVALEGEQVQRGSTDDALPRLSRGSTFRLVARPARALPLRPRVQTFLVHEGRARAWSPPLQLSPEGALKIEGPVEEVLPDALGRYVAVIVVGAQSDLSPAELDAWRAGSRTEQALKLEVELERVAP